MHTVPYREYIIYLSKGKDWGAAASRGEEIISHFPGADYKLVEDEKASGEFVEVRGPSWRVMLIIERWCQHNAKRKP